MNFSDDHLNSSRRPHHQVHRPLIYPLERTSAPASPPRAVSFLGGNHHASMRGWRMGGSSTTRFHLWCRRSHTRPFNYPTLTFEPCNSVFQTLFCPTAFFSRFLCLSSLISLRSKGVLWIVESSSIIVQCFSWKGGPFRCNILFFWYFSDFQRLFQVRSTSMTNPKPLGGVVCHYFYNLEHVHHNCRKLHNKNRRCQSVYY